MIPTLLAAIGKGLRVLVEFLVTAALGVIAAVVLALPWILRAGSVLLWLAGGYEGIKCIEAVYGSTTPKIPLLALEFGVILGLVVWLMGVMIAKGAQAIWGGFASAGGAAYAAARWGIPALQAHWIYADLFFRVLPAALFAMLLIVFSVRMRAKRAKFKRKEVVSIEE